MHRLRKPYLLFLGDVQDKLTAKTAFGLKDWCADDVMGEWSLPGCTITLGLERVAPQEAQRRGAGSIIVGIAPTGSFHLIGWPNWRRRPTPDSTL
jgi:hypothetical protein